jgi:hypothetical protein
MSYKLGKLAPKEHPKTLKFSMFLKANAPPPPPAKVFREYRVPMDAWEFYANDKIGDCTCAAVAHQLMLTTAHTGRMVVPELADVIEMYSAISGYDPNTGYNDNGAAITDALDYWQTHGLAGHKILAWAQIDHKNLKHRNQGVYIFGAVNLGVQLPASAQRQFSENRTWDVVKRSPILGGHCIIEPGYGRKGRNYVTWGKGDQKGTNAWDKKYTDEAYLVIDQSWLNEASGLAPNSMDLDALTAALKALRA